MSQNDWRPLSVETAEDIAEYDALHEGVPEWMRSGLWEWIQRGITSVTYGSLGQKIVHCRLSFAMQMCRTLRIALPPLAGHYDIQQITEIMRRLQQAGRPLDVVDFLLSHGEHVDDTEMQALLDESGSAWTVGMRNGFKGLVRRVPEGVQTAADCAMQEGGRAGVRLARAWELLYGVNPDPSNAYREAVRAVEAASIPAVCPNDSSATLGKVVNVVRTQGWRLPMAKEHEETPTAEVLVGMLRTLWNGQHDRHDNGEPSVPGSVSITEATVAVGLAVTLVHWFSAGVPATPGKAPLRHEGGGSAEPN